ncbi:MAG: NAD-dependent epimerase/dehydratase family protein [Micavibrio sp.]|nr:MAG: NAD-dependent epimerase/dehydratase family protein [Micavibrio sp.]
MFWQRFRKIAEKYPDHIAVTDRGKNITYRNLAGQAAALGKRLNKELGEQACENSGERVIGLEIEKSAEYIIALLGVWHADAAFVPLPPDLPQARKDFIAKDAGITTVLTEKDIPEDMAEIDPAGLCDETLAYIMYTSGSTGTQKGVAIEHRGILNFLDAQMNAFHLTPQSRSLFYLSTAFDASLSDIGTALLSGAALVIEDNSVLRDGKKLVAALHRQGITHMDVPPALLGILSPEDMPETLETVIIGGETCPPEIVRKWAQHFRVINVYGPTEATVCTSLIRCDPETWGAPLIGEAFPNVTYRIEDGELLIGGLQLARGYLNRDDLNAEKFVNIDGERFYKTGDKVSVAENGGIAFSGRSDRQFKLRGQLVAPEEIESCLRAYPHVQKAAVLKRPLHEGGADALVAFVTGRKTPDLDAHLHKQLPQWMVPQHIVWLGDMPETASGKTDFSRLRIMDLHAESAAAVLPEMALEKTLHTIWSAVLKKSGFGTEDNFFDIGGDSLAVIHLSLEAERHGLRISPALLVQYPTIRKLAESLSLCADDSGALPCNRLKKDVAFDAEWQQLFKQASTRPSAGRKNPERIFMTGATGFLGGRLLAELLQRTGAEIVCLLRDPSRLAAKDPRITAVTGDIEQPRFGLAENEWQHLAETVDSVYHCAARVNTVQNYEALRAANILGTREILRFACTGKRKHLHAASTLSVFVATDRNSGTLYEKDKLEKTKYVYGGYAQTKWAAEYMLLQIPEKICPITHYRFGLITGDTETGACSDTDFLKIFVRGIRRLGAIPRGFGESLLIDITPVDYAAAAMAALSLSGAEDIYHIAGQKPLSLGRLTAAIGGIREIPAEDWKNMFRNRALSVEESAAYLALCRCLDDFGRYRTMDLFQATGIRFDTRRTARDFGRPCPPPSDDLLALYLKRFFEVSAQNRRAG